MVYDWVVWVGLFVVNVCVNDLVGFWLYVGTAVIERFYDMFIVLNTIWFDVCYDIVVG